MPHKLKLHTRPEFEAALEQIGESTPIAMALLDLDHFMEINDKLGHPAGDSVLRSLERTLCGSLPMHAIVGRIGGDEYAVALPNTSSESALILLEEIRAHFTSRPPSPEVQQHVQVCIGIASRPPHAESLPELMRAASEALHRAKREGRNRVAIYVEEKMTLKSNYYTKAQLERLAKLSNTTGRTEASLLREGLEELLAKYKDEL
jgi:diguanylate cyclase